MVTVPTVATLKAALPPGLKMAGRRLFLRASAVTNAGSGHSCSCCGAELRQFTRFHGEHDQCSGCGALMRHRALVLLLGEHLGLAERGGYLMHVGPAESVGRWLDRAPRVHRISVDISSPLADVEADVTDLPFEDDSFDFVLCIHVLEHVLDDHAAIRELHRVLKPGGLAVLQVPPSAYERTIEDPSIVTPAEREQVYGQYDHVRICGADYSERFAEAGFEVEELDVVERLPEADRRRYGLRTGEPFFLCRKSP